MLEQNPRVAQRLGWLTYNLRWLLLLAAAFLVLTNPLPAGPVTLGLLILMGVYNFGLTLYEFANPGRPWLILATVALDFVLGLSLYLANGAGDMRLVWIGLLPSLTATLRFNWLWSLLVGAAFLVLQAGLVLAATLDLQAALATAAAGALMLPVILAGAFLARQLRLHIQRDVRSEYKADHQRSDILRQHARAIYEMSSTISATLNYKDVLEAALNFGALGAEPLRAHIFGPGERRVVFS